jgi:DnaJ family protein C protein 11
MSQVQEARVKAEKAQSLVKVVADRKRDKQLKLGGLVVLEGLYGNILDFESKRLVREFGDERNKENEDDIPPPVVDVTTTLNFLVNDSGQIQVTKC